MDQAKTLNTRSSAQFCTHTRTCGSGWVCWFCNMAACASTAGRRPAAHTSAPAFPLAPVVSAAASTLAGRSGLQGKQAADRALRRREGASGPAMSSTCRQLQGQAAAPDKSDEAVLTLHTLQVMPCKKKGQQRRRCCQPAAGSDASTSTGGWCPPPPATATHRASPDSIISQFPATTRENPTSATTSESYSLPCRWAPAGSRQVGVETGGRPCMRTPQALGARRGECSSAHRGDVPGEAESPQRVHACGSDPGRHSRRL